MPSSRVATSGFTLYQISALPKLVWLAKVRHEDPGRAIVYHGSDVECLGAIFVEGVWDGPFDQGLIDESCNFFGSGGQTADDRVVFVSSCAMVDTLWYKTEGALTWVSNSLPLLLSATSDRLSPWYRRYNNFQDSLLKGFRNCEKELATERGSVRRVVVGNLVIDLGGVRVLDKPLPPHFSTYREYVDYLEAAYERILDNIRDPQRHTKLELFSTQSRG